MSKDPLTGDSIPGEAMSEKRFYIDHGVIHDRVTGKHVRTDGEWPFDDTVEMVCDLLNSLGNPARPPAGEDYLTSAEQKAQAARCGCRGSDDYCPCQNRPDQITKTARSGLSPPAP
jgi:hypothetical protein